MVELAFTGQKQNAELKMASQDGGSVPTHEQWEPGAGYLAHVRFTRENEPCIFFHNRIFFNLKLFRVEILTNTYDI